MARRMLALVVWCLVPLSACSDDGATPTTDPVVFGEGTPPPAFPGDFPIPAAAVIGTTLVDRVNHRSEMALQIDGGLVSVVQFYNLGLVGAGYVVTGSTGDAGSWRITFTRGELTGDILLTSAGEFTQAVAAVNGV